MTNHFRAIFVLLCLTTLTISARAEINRDSQVKVSYESKLQLKTLLGMGLDIIDEGDGYIEIISYPDEIDQLSQAGFKTEILKESLSRFYRERIEAETGPKDMGGYKTLDEINSYVDGIVADHPSIVSSKVSLGTTIEGRDMWAIKISDNPNTDEAETEVLFTSAIHAREVITPEVILNAIDYLTDNYGSDAEVTNLVDNREIWFVPVVNPDGYFHNQVIAPGGGGLWRKNRRHNGGSSYGVDLNRNFGYEWGHDDEGSSANPTSVLYRGTGPFSEPETQNMKAFTEAHEFVITVYFHSYSNLILWPWGYEEIYTPEEDLFKQLGDSISSWNGYSPGPGWTLYLTNGTTDDWGYGEQTTKNKNYAFTLEVGSQVDGFWPQLSRIPQMVSENLGPILFLAEIADDIYTIKLPAVPVAMAPDIILGDSYDLSWTQDDTLNPAVSYEVTELIGPSLEQDGAEDFDGWLNEGFTALSSFGFSDNTSFYSGSGNSLIHYFQSTQPLAVEAGDTLRFKTYYDIEPLWDFAYVEVSTDGVSFSPIPGNITVNIDPNGTNRGNGITGDLTTWTEALFDLSAFAGQNIWIRFSYYTDGALVEEGFYVDDIYPHLEFESRTVVEPSLADVHLGFFGRSPGSYYHLVRAIDAQGQYSGYSQMTKTAVIAPGSSADLDLDGIQASVADLTAFELYFINGLSTFQLNLSAQVGQTDVNCDETALTMADLIELRDLLVGRDQPCYTTTMSPSPLNDDETSSRLTKDVTSTGSAKATITPEGTISLAASQATESDSASVQIILSDINESFIGFQVSLEYDTTGVDFVDLVRGDQTTNWPLFDYHQTITGTVATLRIVGGAFDLGTSPSLSDIEPQASSVALAEIKLFYHAETETSTDFQFVWETCSDNNLALGTLDGGAVALDEVYLSRQVFDAALVDITGSSARYGGADGECDNGLLAEGPTSAVDFVSGALTFVPSSCCIGMVGNANGSVDEEPTIADIGSIVDFLFISGNELNCYAEADANLSGAPNPVGSDITIADIGLIVDHLFISGNPLPACP